MATFDATSASCFVFTFKEGLLSPVAHDLKLRVGRFEVTVTEAVSIQAQFDASSLRVVAAIKDGREDPGALSRKDIADIESNIATDVLHPMRYPHVRFVSSQVQPVHAGYEVRGSITIRDRSRTLTVLARREGSRLVAETSLLQPDFGIKPFSAMFGALRIKPEIRVRLELPAP
jgi:polyisoprenoid-binding protein YceI